MTSPLHLSDYFTIAVTVPETHADEIRKAMGNAGAGKFGNYSFCSFSTKGVARFMPHHDAQPYLGSAGKLEAVAEEKIESVCSKEHLEKVIEAIKQAHPYETALIDIYPIYTIGCKLPP